MFVASTGPQGYEITLSLEVINHYISDLMLGEVPWLNTTMACIFPRPWKEARVRQEAPEFPNDQLHHDVEMYLGEYRYGNAGRGR